MTCTASKQNASPDEPRITPVQLGKGQAFYSLGFRLLKQGRGRVALPSSQVWRLNLRLRPEAALPECRAVKKRCVSSLAFNTRWRDDSSNQ